MGPSYTNCVMNRLARTMLIVLPGLILLSCRSGVNIPPHQRPEQPLSMKDAVWQLAWVDPTVIYSDSIFTLIRAARIDSFLVAPGKLQPEIPDLTVASAQRPVGKGGIKFQIVDKACVVSAALQGGNVTISPDLPPDLTAGFYKLTCDLTGVGSRQFSPGPYRVRISFCGQNKGGTLIK